MKGVLSYDVWTIFNIQLEISNGRAARAIGGFTSGWMKSLRRRRSFERRCAIYRRSSWIRHTGLEAGLSGKSSIMCPTAI